MEEATSASCIGPVVGVTLGCLSLASFVRARRKGCGRSCVRVTRSAITSDDLYEEVPEFSDTQLRRAFQKIDRNHSGSLSPEEFLQICMQELRLALTEVEVQRLFANLDTNQSGEISFAKFRHGVQRSALLREIAINYSSMVDATAPENYDYEVPTYIAYRHPDYVVDTPTGTCLTQQYDMHLHGLVHGEFAEIRRTLDYTYHTNYTLKRQEWQDQVVRRVAQCTKPQNRPWIVFTCGAMGSGKGYTMSWLSRHNIFPLEHIVHIDSDHFKSLMPEWKGYVSHNAEEAGTMCHKESGFLQEIAQEVAMRGSQNIWVDGSMGDHEWYTRVFMRIRRCFPKYRISLIYVHCSEEQLFQRAEKRGKMTGRIVPMRKLKESIEKTARAVDVLSPLADFAAKIDNRGDTPWLEVCQDRSHSFVTLRNQFQLGKPAKHFPESLHDVSVKHDPYLSEMLVLPRETRDALCSGTEEMQRVPLLMACRPKLRARLEAEMKSRLDILHGTVHLLLTPAAKVNMDAHSRSRADIPPGACLCALCHGCCAGDGRPVNLLPNFGKGMGAFIYMNSDAEIISVNVMARRSPHEEQFFIHCAKPLALPAQADWKLELADRWVRHVTPPEALRSADAMAWLLPGELPDCPFGGFAYRIKDGPEVFFPLVTSE